MAEDDDFTDAQPYLFGKGFERKAKERTEALDCLRKAKAKDQRGSDQRHNSYPGKKFFQGNRSHQNGGNGSGNFHRRNQNAERSFRRPNYQQRTNTYTKLSGVTKTQQ